MASVPDRSREGRDGHSVDARGPLICLDPFPDFGKVFRGEDPLHYGLFLRTPILPIVTALIFAPPAGGIGSDVLHAVGTLLVGLTLHGIKISGFLV